MDPRKKMSVVSGMTTRQKIVAVALVVVLFVIIYQIIGLFGSSAPVTTPKATTASNQPTTMSANAPNQPEANSNPNTGTPQMPAGQAGNQPVVIQQEAQPQLKEAVVSLDNQLLKLQKETEQKYIDQLNQLQMLKVQREIAEANQAIASARLATVTAEKNVSDLLTKPAQPIQPVLPPPPVPVPEGAYANALMTPAPSGETPSTPPVKTPIPPPPEAGYVVISVSMQFGRWSAVLGSQGKLYNVSVGDVLPVDRSVVAAINKSGVVLIKNRKKTKISLVTSV